jgi:hypothetical protein
VAVTSVEIEPAGVFDKDGSGCGGEPSCEHSSFTADRPACSVAVTATSTEGKSARLVMRGTVQCEAGLEQTCTDMVADVRGQSIQLQQPNEEPSETPTT